MADRQLKVTLVGDSRQLDRTLGRTEKRLDQFSRKTQALQAGRGVLSTTGGKSGFLFGSTAFVGGALGAGVLKTTLSAASDLNEQLSRTRVVFGSSGDAAIAWSKNLATSFGLAQTQALEAAGTFGAFFRNAGKDTQEALKLSRSIVELGADLASFNNTSVSDALDALRSGLSGEIEPLRRFQVFLTESAVAQRAMTDTGKKSVTQLTQGERILARYELIMAQTTRAQGDFARTSGGAANQQRILQAQLANTEAELGTKTLPLLVKTLTALNHAIDGYKAFGSEVGSAFGHLRNFTDMLHLTKKGLNDVEFAADKTASSIKGLTGPVGKPVPSFLGIPGLTGPAGTAPKPRPPSLITQLPNTLRSQELDARLSGHNSVLRAILVQEAQALRSALKDPRLRESQRVQLKQELLGITEEIKQMDDQLVQAAKDKKQAAIDARKKAAAEAAAAKKKLAEANRAMIQKFKDQADAIKSAVLEAFDAKTDRINNARALADAKAALRVARQIGGPQGIKLALRDVTDAQRAIRRQQLEETAFRVGQGPAGPVNKVTVGTQNFYITTADPEKAAREVIRLLNRKQGGGAPQHRGRAPGQVGGRP